MALVIPLKNSPSGQYEEPVDPNADSLSANGFYPQNSTSGDAVVGLERDSSGNLVLKDGITGTKTLAMLSAAGDYNLDGGFAASVYLVSQNIDGGGA